MVDPDGSYERKIQLTGGTTYTVSLPKPWANAQGIEVGDRFRLHPRGDRILVAPSDAGSSGDAVTVSAVQYSPEQIGQIVVAAYVAGATTVRIEGRPDRAVSKAVREAAAGLVGVEVATESDSEIVVRTMLDVADLSPTQTLAQLESVALSIHEAAVDAALAADGEAGRRVAARDDSVDRLFGLVAREFQRSLVDVTGDRAGNGLTTFDQYTVARQLERVGDHAEKIAQVAERIENEPPTELADELTELAADARAVVRRALSETLNGRNPETLSEVLTEGAVVVEETSALDRALYDRELADGYALATVLDSITRTAEYGRNIAEAGLRASLRNADAEPVTDNS